MVVVMFVLMIVLTGVVLIITANGSDDRMGFGLLLTVFSSLAFIVLSFEKDITAEWVPREVFAVKTPRLVLIDDGNKVWELKDYGDVVSVNDSTVFLFEETTNLWGEVKYEGIKIEKK